MAEFCLFVFVWKRCRHQPWQVPFSRGQLQNPSAHKVGKSFLGAKAYPLRRFPRARACGPKRGGGGGTGTDSFYLQKKTSRGKEVWKFMAVNIVS